MAYPPEIRNIPIRQGADHFLPLFALVENRRHPEVICIGGLHRMEGVFEYHGVPTVSAEVLHGTAENDGLVLAMTHIGAGEDGIEETVHPATLQSRLNLIAFGSRGDAHGDAAFLQPLQKFHDAGFRPDLMDVKILNNLVDACRDFLHRQIQAVFLL